jgi:predicted DNA-binding transcriptional regulator AlpA
MVALIHGGWGKAPDRPEAVASRPLRSVVTEFFPSGLGCLRTPSGEAGHKGISGCVAECPNRAGGGARPRRARPGPLVFAPYPKKSIPAFLIPVADSRPCAHKIDTTGRFVALTRLTGRSQSHIFQSIAVSRNTLSREVIPARRGVKFFLLIVRRVGYRRSTLFFIPCMWVPTGCTEVWVRLNERLLTCRIVEISAAFTACFVHSGQTTWRCNFHCVRLEMNQQPVGAAALLNIKQVTQALGVCRRTLEREINRQRFPRPVKIGSASRWPSAEVFAYIDRLCKERGATSPES